MNYLADYSEKRTIAASHKAKEREFWMNQLAGEPVKSSFPTDFKRGDPVVVRRAELEFQLSSVVYSRLTDLCSNSDHALYIILAAGLTLLVHKYTQNTDILIGSPIYQQDTLNDFINTMLVLRNQVEPSMNFKQLVGQMKQNIWAATENYGYPLELLMEQLGITFSNGEFPFFDIVILLENIHHKSYIRNISPNVIFSFSRTGESIKAVVEYNSQLYMRETIERISNHFNVLMERVLPVPDKAFSGLDILLQEEKWELLEGFNRTDGADTANKTIARVFTEMVELYPDRTAVVLAGHHMSYCFLNERANRMAGVLRKKGVKPNVIVGLMLERSLDMLIAILGVLKAGGVYLPLEPGTPQGRIVSILKDCQSQLLLTTGTASEKYSFSTLLDIDRKKIVPYRTGVRPPIRDLDSLPFPNRSLVNYGKYHNYISVAMAKHTISIMGSRGCPYNCVYCHKIWPKNHIVRSAEDIFKEVRMYYNVGIRRFSIIDDIFNLNIKNSARFFQLVLKHGLKVHFFFPGGVRGDILTKEYIDLMVEAGTINVLMPLETASPRIQQLVRKNLDIDKFQKNLEYLVTRYPQVIVEMNIMHGFPTETEKEAMMSVDFVKQYKWIHFPNFNILKIFSNTDMERLAMQHGISKEAIQNSFNKAYHEIPETIPFDKSITLKCRADLFNNYFLKKERFLDILPHQMKVLSEDELVQKYDSYLPVDIKRFYDLLQFVGINWDQLECRQFLDENKVAVPDFSEKIKQYFPAAPEIKGAGDGNSPLRILLIDVSKFFSSHNFVLYDVTEPPLGLMYILSYLQQEFGEKINGKIIHSRIDFDSYGELKSIIAEFKPDIIGVRSLSYHRDFFHQTISFIRQWGIDVPIIVGGPYATSDSAAVLQDRNIDLLVMGEGEITFARVVEKIIGNNGKLPGEEVLKQIPGLAFIPQQERQTSNSTREILFLDQLPLSREEANSPGMAEHHAGSSDPAYVMFTSGSTGSPKGILTTHANVLRMARDTNYINLTPQDRLLQLSNYAFDGSVFDIYGALLNGAALVMMTREDVLNLDRLSHLLQEENITIFFVTTALFNMLTDLKLENLSNIKNVLFGGERVSPDHVRKALNRMGKGKILHMYGPTETTVFATYHRIDEIDERQETIAIGTPISATSIYVLDRHLMPVPRGVTGQICISGTGVSPGYLNRPELTAKKIIYNLLGKDERIYLSGDLGRWLPTGHLQFVGRIDNQVKIRGFRIEPGEIEMYLMRLEGIRKALVTVRGDKHGDRYLCAYIVLDRDFVGKLDMGTIREKISMDFPDYMMPRYFLQLQDIPLNPNGKIDRKTLPEPELAVKEEFIAPENEVQKKIAGIWSEILMVKKELIGIDSNFFELGGHSLRATVLISKLNKSFDVKVPLEEFFKNPTIKQLSEYIEAQKKDSCSSLEAVEKKEYYLLSSAQKRLYFLQQMELASTAYNIPVALVLEGKLNRNRLEDTLCQMVKRHESLRTSLKLVNDVPVQIIHKHMEFGIEYCSLEYSEELESRINRFVRPFDLSQAPLLRAILVKTGDEKYIMILDMHHIVTDGTSMGFLVKEFSSLYAGEELPPLKLQYKDYAQWQNSDRQKKALKKQEEYWLGQFANELPVLNLPLDYSRPAFQSFEGDVLGLELSVENTRALKQVALDTGATLYMVLLAIYNILLSKLSGQEDIIVGTPIAARRHVDLQQIIGMFVNTIVLRNQPVGEKPFIDFLKELKKRTLQVFENQEYSFEDLVEQIYIERDVRRNPIFDTMFVLQNLEALVDDVPLIDMAQLRIESYEMEIKIAKFDLILTCQETGERLFCFFEYCTKLFKHKTIKRFINYFQQLISFVIEDRSLKISQIEIITGEEKKKILYDFNDTAVDYSKDKTIHQLFEEQVERTPDNIALHGCMIAWMNGKEGSITYKASNEKANRLAGLLIEKGIQPDSIVGIMIERSVEMIIGILGILKAGGAYMPIDPDYPQERIDYMLKDSGAKLLVTTNNKEGGKVRSPSTSVASSTRFLWEETLPNGGFLGRWEGEKILLEEIPKFSKCSTHPLTFLHSYIQNSSEPATGNRQPASSLAYIIYTSGTTGQPKGSLIEHRNVVRLLFNDKFQFDFSDRDVWTLFHSFCFDFSVWEMYGALLYGGKLVIVPKMMARDTVEFLGLLNRNAITVLNQTPSAFYNLINEGLIPHLKEVNLYIKYVIFGGEALNPSKLKIWLEKYPRTRFVNMFGITETTVHVTYKGIAEKDIELNISNIGKPIPTLSTYILDKYLKPVPVGVTGEICVGGDGVARGYLNRVELTKGKFIENPYKPGDLLYRSGDTGRFLENGDMQYLGRIDHQVKIRGFRVELGEIENCILKHPGIKEAVLLAWEEESGVKYLCAYIVSDKDSEYEAAGIREYLSKELPDYMIPSYFVRLEKVPLTPNGKVDSKALPKPEVKTEQHSVAPRNGTEATLVGLWAAVLNIPPDVISIDRSFFELGGHSLKATVLAAKLHKVFNVKVPLEEIFRTPNIRGIARLIHRLDKDAFQPLVLAEEKEYYQMSYAQRRLWVLCQFEAESTAYNMSSALILSGVLNTEAFGQAVQSLAKRHESLRTIFIPVNGEYRQKIIHDFIYNLETIDLRGLEEKEREEKTRRLYLEIAEGAFDLEKGPLFRFVPIRIENEKYVLVCNVHHIINDGWSQGIIYNELITLYNAYCRGSDNPLPPLEVQYKDYTRWHNRLTEDGYFARSGKYWLEKFKDKPNGIELPLDHPRKPVQTFNGGRVTFSIDKEKTAQLRQLGLDLDATFFMTLLTLLNIFLYRYTGQKDIIVGAPIANRKQTELHSIIGFLVNTVLYRCQVDPGESFTQLLEKIKQETLTCYQYQDYPFDILVDQLELDRDLSQSPLFNFMLAHNNAEIEDIELTIEGITVSPYPHSEDFNMSKFDLIFFMDEYEKGEVYTRIEYNSDLFDRSTIERMADNFLTLVDNVIAGIDTPIFELNIISDIEYERIIRQFNNTNYQYSCSGLTLQELFENQVEQSGEKTAVVCNGEKISYQDLNRRVNQLAHYLRNRYSIKPNDVIGVSVDRSIDMIVTLWGIIKSGGAYLALDPTYPRERVLHILSNSQADLLIIDKMRPELFGGYQGEIIDIHLKKEKIARESPGNPAAVNRLSDILYVNYTSGSTGIPNGAMLSHDCLTNLIQWQNEKTAIDGSLRCLQFTSINFCVSFQEIMGTLTAGGELYLIGDIERQDIDYLMDFLSQNQIELLFLPFSYLNFLFNESTRWNRSFNHNLKHIITAGEQLKITVGLKGFLDLNPGLNLHNHYGSTEMHVVTSYTLDASTAGQIPIPPAGKPIANVKIRILDEYFNPVPIGVWGELFVDGKSEILGYINNSVLTDQKLVKHPLLSEDNKRLYRSGDIGRWKEDGNIELRGRKDFQVKVRGFRVEPGEIESKLLSIERIQQCVVVVKEDESHQKYLVAYVVGDNIDVAEIKRIIGSELPQYMIPKFIILECLPLMPNGKVDREHLPEPEMKVEKEYTAPRHRIEEVLEEIWSELLGIEKHLIGIDANFFELGGHSLKATLLMSKIHKQLNVKIPLVELFMNPTIRGLSEYIKDLTEDKYVPVEPAEEKEYYALSSAQKRMYILMEMESDGVVYNMPAALELEGELDVRRLEEVFIKLIRRHESLRTSFMMINKEPVQKILEDVEFEIEYYNISKVEEREKLHRSSFIIHHSFIRPFDSSHAPLFRVGLVNLAEKRHILMVDMHHIISDGTSIGGLTKEFMALYAGLELPPLKIQYRDFSQWQNSEKIRETVKKQEEYWLKEFAGEIPVLNIPTDHLRPLIQRFEGNTIRVEIGAEDTKALRALSLTEKTTLFMLLLALYNLLLSRLSAQDEIIVGTPTAGRRHADLQQVIGMFVNTLALRNFPAGDKSFKRFLQDVKERTLEAFENQEYQFEDLVEKVSVSKDTSRNPLFDTMFVLQNMEKTELEIPDLKLKSYEFENKISKFDITFQVYEVGQCLIIFIEYSTAIFEEETIRGFLDRFSSLIKAVCCNPGIRISEIDLLTEEEKHQLIYRFNDTATAYPRDKTIHELFEEQVERTDDGAAIVCVERSVESRPKNGTQHITYNELNEKSNHLARLLKAQGVGSDTVAGIMVERSIEMIVGIMGILKAGGAYLPIDPNYPPKRIDFMLKDSNAAILLTSVDLSNCQLSMSFEKSFAARSQQPAASLAYIIYTSGSTGKPKGILVEHTSAVNTLYALQEKYPFMASDVYLLKTPYIFDVSVTELFGWFLGGGRLAVLEKNGEKDPSLILDAVERYMVTHINFVPSLFNIFVDHLNHGNIEKLSSVKYLLLAGEALLPQLVIKFRALNRAISLENLYGPTEAAVYASGYSLSQWEGKGALPIGKPLPNVSLYILDRNNLPQPLGVSGELCIGGAGLARGYLNNPELTAKKFIEQVIGAGGRCRWENNEKLLRGRPDASRGGFLEKSSPGSRRQKIYKTGDLARWLPDGNIDFLGRIDSQVKIRGNRIETGEIKSRLSKYPGIKEVVVLVKQSGRNSITSDDSGDPCLCAYLVSREEIPAFELREYLSHYLPDYMVPSYYVWLEKMPLTSNGKLNRKVLPEPEINIGGLYTPPRHEVEKKLVEIWAEVLEIEKDIISVDANFFELGGHSLRAAVLVLKIHKALDVKIPLAEVFKRKTILGLSEYINGSLKDRYAAVEVAEKKEYYALSSAQYRMYVLQKMGQMNTSYNIPTAIVLEGALDTNLLEETFKRLVNRHDSFRTSFRTLEGEPVQEIHEEVTFSVEKIDLTITNCDGEASVGQEIIRNFIRPFKLDRAPLMRVGLIHTHCHFTGEGSPRDRYILEVDMHHIISDGVSGGLLIKEFMGLYSGETLPPLRIQYKDFSGWQKKMNVLEPGTMVRQEEYWQKQFAGDLPQLNLLTDYERPPIQSYEGNTLDLEIGPAETAALRKIAHEEEVTLFTLLLTIYHVFLTKLSGQEDIVVGTVTAGREHADLQNVIGMFVNMLALRNNSEGKETFAAFLKEVHVNALEAFENQDYPFEDLVAKVISNRDFSRNALFDVGFALQNIEMPELEISKVKIKPYQLKHNVTKFDLLLMAVERGEKLALAFEYCIKLFKQTTIERFVKYFKEIVSIVVKNREIGLDEIKISHQLLEPNLSILPGTRVDFDFQSTVCAAH